MADLGELRAKIVFDGADEAKKKLKNVKEEVDELDGKSEKAQSSVSSFGEKLKKAFTAAAVIEGVKNIAAGIANIVNAYGELEQSEGGARALFGEGFEAIKANAQGAAQAVQLSQNEYYQYANSISGAVKRGCGDDMQAVVGFVDEAVSYAADSAALLGKTTDEMMGMLVSIANGNFQTLDRLTQGAYSGSEEGLKKLMSDASTALGQTLKSDNYTDIITALQWFAEEQGFAGQATEEASKTIQGSYATMEKS